MADNTNQTVVLRVQLDEGKTEDQLKQLVLDIEKTRAAQLLLTKERRVGIVTDEQFAQQTVALRTQLKGQQQEQTALTKNLDKYRAAQSAEAESYDSLQKQLEIAQTQYRALAGSSDNSTEATQALSAVIRELRTQLKATDADALEQFQRNIGDYPQGLHDASEATQKYANNLVGLRQKLADLTKERESADVGTEKFEELNRAILETQTAVQRAEGKIDEFGDRVKKNAHKEDIDTLGDAFGGVTAAIQLSSLAMDDQEDAAQVTAKATQFLANVEAARSLQIGLANAKDAVAIGLQQAKNLLFTQQAVATTATTAATTASTTATVGQTMATTGATLAQRALNLALSLNPIGAVVLLIGALVGAFFAYRNASDATQKKVRDITETVIRFTTPIGLLVTGLQYLYQRSEAVRSVLKPLGEAFDFVSGKVSGLAREAGEAIGLLDTAEEKAAKVSAAAVENSEKEIASYQLRARELEKAGAAVEQYRSTEREGFIKHLADLEEDNKRQNIVKADELAAIDAKKFASEQLSKSEQELYNQRREREQKLAEARLALADFDQATQDKVVAREKAAADARTKELTAIKSAGERAKKQAEQNLKDQFSAQEKLLQNRQQQIARALALTREGSEEELKLLREQATNAARIQLASNSKEQVGVGKKDAAALVAARKEILANGQAAELKVVTEFAQKRAVTAFQASLDNLQTELAGVQAGSSEEVKIKQQALEQQLALDLAGIDKRKDLQAQEAERDRLRAAARQQAAELEYQHSLTNLENYFADREQAIERDHAAGDLSDKQYQAQLLANQQARVAAAKVVAKDYNRDVAQLNREGAQLDTEATEHYAAEIKARIAAGQQFGEQVGQLFADILTDQGKTLQDFTAGVLVLILDVLEKQMLATVGATVFQATAESVATPQSALTAGAAGFAQAALLSAAIVAAFEVGKGLVKASLTTPKKQFAQGTVLGGSSHADGGTQLFGLSGHWFGEAEAGEAVINKRSTTLFLPLLSVINQAGGGRPLTASLPAAPRMALGGLAAPLVQQQLAGNADMAANFQRLGQQIAKINIYVKTQEMMQSIDKVNYTKNDLGSS